MGMERVMAKKQEDGGKQLERDIAEGKMSRFYLLYGEDDYRKKQYRDKLTNALISKDDTMNYHYFTGDKLEAQQVLELGETLPFFAERRVIVLENTGWFDNKAQEGLEERLEQFPESTFVIFVEQKVDGKRRFSKWMAKNGRSCMLNHVTGYQLEKWVLDYCKDRGKEITVPGARYLIEYAQADMMTLDNELHKLLDYCYDKEKIEVEDIREICVSQAHDTLFAMLDAIGDRNQDQALLLYHDLLALHNDSSMARSVLATLSRHFRILMEASKLVSEGKGNAEIAAACGVNNYFIGKYVSQAKQYSYAGLKGMVEKCQDTQYAIVSGKLQDIVGVELLIVEFSGKSRA